MRPDPTILELARAARESGLFARLAAYGTGTGTGMAAPGAIHVSGKDALRFVHSQVTNEVEGLAPGQGNASARVTRQGQLVELFSLHRLEDGDTPSLLLVLEAERVAPVLAEMDGVLFADDVVLRDVSAEYVWLILQGPSAPAVMDAVAPLASGSWASAPAYSATPLIGDGWPIGALCIARSLTGDAGFMIAWPTSADDLEDLIGRLREAAGDATLESIVEPELSALLEVLRIEAGIVRIGPDTQGRKRILPETGLEQQTVSYTKGCYLGQEVIARVRTYGALPFSLRGLVFDDAGADVLDRLPAPSENLLLSDGAKTIGQLASRTYSPVLDAPVAFAYLDKKHRTPGEVLCFRGTDGSTLSARVVLLPFYSSPNSAERVAWLYDRAVRLFAGGKGDQALDLLEEVLRIDPSFSDGYEAIGVLLGREERFHEAIDIFKRLEEIAPQEPMVNTNLSLYFMKIGDKETAEDHAAKAMQKSMAKSAGREVDDDAISAVMAEQKHSDALRKKAMFSEVLEIDAEDDVALFGLGNALAVLGELEQAAGLYARAARVERDNSAVYLAHGKVLEQLGRAGDAEVVYRTGMQVASRKGDLMPLKEMEHRVLLLAGGVAASGG
ncbi:MAG: hypothetical protein JRH17_11620 [Deltaproteobacteria bacterium]|nr:hypothetical protein [Deltaproteobacteria bacterium]